MTTSPNRKEETRRRLLDAAGRSFRANGFAGIGVDGIAQEAGATSGAFYAHFGSKIGAFDAALAAGLDEVLETLPRLQQQNGAEWLRDFAAYYLGTAHRGDLACGCAMTTLTSEVVRAGEDTHAIYEAKMTRIAAILADGLTGGSEADRLTRAWAIISVLTGGLALARAMHTPGTADSISTAIIDAVERLAVSTS